MSSRTCPPSAANWACRTASAPATPPASAPTCWRATCRRQTCSACSPRSLPPWAWPSPPCRPAPQGWRGRAPYPTTPCWCGPTAASRASPDIDASMGVSRVPRLGLALATAAALAGIAAAAEPPAAPDEAEAPAAAPAQSAPVGFESTLSNYRPYRADEPLEDWRAANAAVGRAGGMAGHGGHQPAAPDSGQMRQEQGEHGR